MGDRSGGDDCSCADMRPRKDHRARGDPNSVADEHRAVTPLEARRVGVVLGGQQHGLRRDIDERADHEPAATVEQDIAIDVAVFSHANTAASHDTDPPFERTAIAELDSRDVSENRATEANPGRRSNRLTPTT